jgi:transposase
MRRIRQVLQLHFGAHASARVIAREVGIGRTTVQDYLARATAVGLGWPLPPDLTDEAVEQLLFPASGNTLGARRHPEPDWATLVREMKRPGVSLSILWEEYDATHSDAYRYSRFCELYRAFERRLSPTMRQSHVAGHKAFVDYSGKKVPIADPLTGEVRMAEIFVAVLGASNLTYAEASWTQSLPDWIGAYVRMFRFFGAAPRLLVPDNLKSAVHKPSFYDPEVTRIRRPIDRRSRPQRWDDATNVLLGLQAEYVDWLAALPDSLRGTAMAEALEAIADLDLTALAETKPPRGYGRD